MIDLSGYEGVHVLKATATINKKPSWCIITTNVDRDDERPHTATGADGSFLWIDNSCVIRFPEEESISKIHSIIGEMVLPGSLEAPAEHCNCDIPATCTISTECSETNPVVKELISAMTRQFEMVVGVLEKFAQAE